MINAYIDISRSPAYERDALRDIEEEIHFLFVERLRRANLRSAVTVASTTELVVEPGRTLRTNVSISSDGLPDPPPSPGRFKFNSGARG